MSRTDNEVRVTPSLLDRLIDLEPKSSQEALQTRSNSLRELKQSVQRDLEWLLNTRAYLSGAAESLSELSKSVAVYGLPDFTGVSAKNHLEQSRMTKAIETAIKNFEPRFLDLRVSLEPISTTDKSLRFRIEANLNIEPSPEPVAFDTVLKVGSGDFEIKEV
ncbi:MAG: type VI secretion system baseplate subunit TssE [Pyrinomonadaceae bacterium]|nr:type VI secretion system baseplate subunit TssE [Pyrinomonadaceae bacterium]